jgi:2-polyprenyl-3-methyl-5-hydroxy-6-metoxy-1,4-benzoquinol methylase
MRRTRKDGSLLDIGTGIGQFLYQAKPFYTSVTGTEVSESAILIAREKYNLDVIHGKIEDVEFGDEKFDNITLFHVLEHVPSPRAVIERCRDLLTPAGILVVAVPNDILSAKFKRNGIAGVVKGITARESEIIRNLSLPRVTLDGSMEEIHLSHFTPGVLQRFLEASGFFVLENSLDPYYAVTGMSKLKQDLKYVGCALLKFLFKRNVYDSIWIAAKKN